MQGHQRIVGTLQALTTRRLDQSLSSTTLATIPGEHPQFCRSSLFCYAAAEVPRGRPQAPVLWTPPSREIRQSEATHATFSLP